MRKEARTRRLPEFDGEVAIDDEDLAVAWGLQGVYARVEVTVASRTRVDGELYNGEPPVQVRSRRWIRIFGDL
ncbi:hypothetical protein M6B38_143255 [Iris pallida]|uniref:Uncharacterized protein n=1 Tax=Iris pallida TaxID=29817 RepID=A0AAX6FC28_IRIPA|nr:hypothetical protein M6B38_143255 [Iris pallida]